jgi:DNA processing protein
VTAGRSSCDACLARSWLLARLSGHLERVRSRIVATLGLPDEQLIAAVGGRAAPRLACELENFDPDRSRSQMRQAGVGAICRCAPEYPSRLRLVEAPPAVLFVAGTVERLCELAARDPVAVVGARSASSYGLEIANSLGRGLGAAGITVVSGMALGVDSAAHSGALEAGNGTIAVLAGSCERPYPAAKRSLHRRIVAGASAIGELPPGSPVWRWSFPARNRIIAGLSEMTVVVEAGERSGALLTAGFANALGRPVGAVPGRVTSPLAAGPHRLLAQGAHLVRGPQDVLDALYCAGAGAPRPDRLAAETRAPLAPELRRLLEAIASGSETLGALTRTGIPAEDCLAGVAALELAGYVRRHPGGRLSVVP